MFKHCLTEIKPPVKKFHKANSEIILPFLTSSILFPRFAYYLFLSLEFKERKILILKAWKCAERTVLATASHWVSDRGLCSTLGMCNSLQPLASSPDKPHILK